MAEHRTTIGGTLLAGVFACWVGAATIVALATPPGKWSRPLVFMLLALGGLALIGSLWAFGFWGWLTNRLRPVASAVANWNPIAWRGLPSSRSAAVVSVTSCSRTPKHMELFWTDGSGRVFHRWWLEDQGGWSAVHHWDEPSAVYVAAVSRQDGDQLLFGMPRRGEVWMRSWDVHPQQGRVISGPLFLPGEAVGPLTAVSRRPSHVELDAWTPEGEQCHRWSHDEEARDGWTQWRMDWSRPGA